MDMSGFVRYGKDGYLVKALAYDKPVSLLNPAVEHATYIQSAGTL